MLIVGSGCWLFLYNCVPYRIIELIYPNLRNTLWIFLTEENYRGASWPNTWKMCSLSTFWKSIFRSFTCFSLLILYERKKKNSNIHFLPPSDRNVCVKEGRRGRRTWRTSSRVGFKQQNVFSQPRLGDNNTDFHVACTPKPAMSLASVKHSPHWSCDESKKARFSGDLASFLVCARKFIWLNSFLFSCLHVACTNKNLGNERVTTFLTHASSWSVRSFLMQDGVSNVPDWVKQEHI